MQGYAKSQFLGTITRDPEIRYTPSGTAVANFGIAVNESRKDKDGNKIETVSFFDIEAWKHTAEFIHNYLKKGENIFVEAKPKQDRWEDNDGNKRNRVKFTAVEVRLLGRGGRQGKSGQGGSGNQQRRKPNNNQEPQQETFGEDIPF